MLVCVCIDSIRSRSYRRSFSASRSREVERGPTTANVRAASLPVFAKLYNRDEDPFTYTTTISGKVETIKPRNSVKNLTPGYVRDLSECYNNWGDCTLVFAFLLLLRKI